MENRRGGGEDGQKENGRDNVTWPRKRKKYINHASVTRTKRKGPACKRGEKSPGTGRGHAGKRERNGRRRSNQNFINLNGAKPRLPKGGKGGGGNSSGTPSPRKQMSTPEKGKKNRYRDGG